MSLNAGGFELPSAYQDGYSKAQSINPQVAATYIRNTVIDDLPADRAVETLASLDARQVNRLMTDCMNVDCEQSPDVPQTLRDFFEPLRTPPAWFDRDAVLPGRLAYHKHLSLFMIGFIIVSLRNFNSLMARIFFLTGQGTTQQGLQVIRQNIRYLSETLLLPGALDPGQSGWKFSIRIRLVHARIRRQLRASGQWNEAVYGTPISAANMALASANFSVTLIRYVEQLGADLDADARSSLMQIWRYASWLIGTPESLLCEGDEGHTAELSRIGHICEPPPDNVSVLITNSTVKALPELADLKDPVAKEKLIANGYQVARALLGDELADQFEFPRHKTVALLPRMRCSYRLKNFTRTNAPRAEFLFADSPFISLLQAAGIGDLQHRLPPELQVMHHPPRGKIK